MAETPVITAEELRDYLGIDYADQMVERNLERSIRSAHMWLSGALGSDYPREDDRCKELALIAAADYYENRSFLMGNGLSGKARPLVADLLLQVRLEMRRESDG